MSVLFWLKDMNERFLFDSIVFTEVGVFLRRIRASCIEEISRIFSSEFFVQPIIFSSSH